MGNFFKNFGKGVLYILVLPLLIVGLAVYGVAAVFVFLFLAVKGLILFFTGRSLYEDLPEDIEAKKRLKIYSESAGGTTVISTEPIYGENQEVQTTDPFYVPEYLKSTPEQEEAVEETQAQEEPVISEPESEPEPAPEAPVIEERNQSVYDILTSDDEEVSAQPQEIVTEQEDTINIQKQPQNSVILDINEIDDEDEEENSGINIDYQ